MATTRRGFLEGMVATAGLGLLTRPRTAFAGLPEGMTADERYLWRMIYGIDLGEPFHADWYLLDAYPPVGGGVTLVVSKGREGKPLRVDVVRRDDPPRAPAYTDHLELFTMDGGGGVKLLPHDMIDALQALAERLEDNEAQHALASKLLTHRERIQRYPTFMERAATELAPTPADAAKP